ncbi:MAG: hypothetical protein AAGE98_18820 [Actinomycetota bacterium]
MVFVVLIAAVVFITGLFPPSATTLALFSDLYEVPITAENRPMLERYIRGSRICRMVGVLVAAAGLTVVVVTTDGGGNTLFYLGVAYGLGAVAYELFRRAPGPGGANLTRRHLDDYVNPWINRLLLVAIAVGVIVYVLSFVFEPRPDQTPSLEIESYRTISTVALVGLAAAALAARRIVQAPQPVISPAVDAAQHATRTAGLMSLVGLALMAAGVVTAGAVEIGRSDAPTVFGDVVSIVGMSLSIVASFLGFFLTVRSLPRFAPFWRKLPDVEPAGGAS